MNTTEINGLLPMDDYPAYTTLSDGTVVKYYDVDGTTRDAVICDLESITFIHFDSAYDLEKNKMGPREARFSVTSEGGGIDWTQVFALIDSLWMDPDLVEEDPDAFQDMVLDAFEGMGQLTEY